MAPSWRERILRWTERVASSESQKAELNRIYDLVSPHELGAALSLVEPATGESVWIDKLAGAVTRRLTEIGTPEAEDVLIRFLDDPRVDVRRAAANRLSEDPPARSIPEFDRLLADPDEEVRVAAIVAMTAARHEPALTRLEELAQSGGRLEKRVAKRALTRIAD